MTVNWGIIGMGNIADLVTAPAMVQAKNNRLVAVMRRDLQRAEAIGTPSDVLRKNRESTLAGTGAGTA